MSDWKDFGRDERRQVTDFLTGNGHVAFLVALGVLALLFVWFLVAGLVS